MNWTGGRRTKIQATAERMRQRQRFDRQRRLAMATYDQDLQQQSSIIPDHVQGPSHSPLTAIHRTSHLSKEKFSPLFIKKESDGGATTRTRDAHQAQRQDPTSRAAVISSRASLASGRSTHGDTSLVASGLDLGTMDYRTARLECLKVLKSPSFDWLGEAYQLRPSELLERSITPPSQTSREPHKRAHQISAARRTDHGGRVHDDAGYSQSDSGADDEDEDDEDEPLQVPAKHRAVCRELQTKRGRTDIDVEDMVIQPQESSAEELGIETAPHPADITEEEVGQNRAMQVQVDEASLSRILKPVHSETIAEHLAVNLGEGNTDHGSDMPSKTTPPRGADPPAVEHTLPISVFADSSAPVDQAMSVAKETQIQAETGSQARQSLPAAPGGVNELQEPFIKDSQETENRSLETREIEISSASLPATDARVTEIYVMDVNPAAFDETCLQPAEPLNKEQHASASQPPSSPTPDGMSPVSHATEPTDAKSQLTVIPPAEARPIRAPAPHVASPPRSTHSHSSPTHEYANLPDRRRDNNSGETSAQETEQRPVEMYSQSVPSEMEAPLYSDDEDTPHQSNSHNYSINQEDDYVDPDEVSPEVSTQYTLSKQSSIVSAFEWFPANQEQAARISLQEQEHPSRSTLMQSNASHPQAVGDSGYHYDDYDFHGGGSSFSFRDRSQGVHAQEQEQRQQYQHGSLIRLPSDPWDVDALGPILGSQDDFGYDQRWGDGDGTGSGGVIQGLGSAFERGELVEGGEDDALSEWIHDDEW